MYSNILTRKLFQTNLIRFIFSVAFGALTLFATSDLSALGWGKTNEIFEYENSSWNGVYFEASGIHLTASIPNYDGTSMSNGSVSIFGEVGEDIGYVIVTSMNEGFIPPATLDEMLQILQEVNPGFTLIALDAQQYGAKYAIEMTPDNEEGGNYWRFISTNSRLIKLGTNDANFNRRVKFFESLRLR